MQELLSTTFSNTYQSAKAASPSVVGATDIAPYVVGLDSITKVRMFALKVVSGASIKVKLTSVAGALQSLYVSSLLLWNSPNSGDEITVIQLVGTADVELVIAGDTA